MNTFKNKTLIKFFPVLLLFMWTGCEDLDFPDPNNPTDETATVQSLATGIEAGMRIDIGIYLRNILVVGREAYYLEPADPRYTGELMTGPIDDGGFIGGRPWNASYKVIQNCLNLLEHADADKGTDGYAKTMQAYMLWRVLSLTDVNGARLTYDGSLVTTASTKAEVITEIENLLDAGYSDLNAADDDFSFILSRGFEGYDDAAGFAMFNRALRARVAVNQNDWTVALTALDNSFLNASGDLDEGVYHIFSSSSNDQDNEMYESATADYIKLMVHPGILDAADAEDTRFTNHITIREDTIKYNGLESYLAPTVWASSYDDIPIIRNEELILLRAEAYIGNADYTSAEDDMNIVRTAAGLDDLSGTSSSNAVERVLNEKRFSLFFEGQRLIDMRHYGMEDDLPLDRTGDAIVTFPIPATEFDE